jgi:hypothetical protein
VADHPAFFAAVSPDDPEEPEDEEPPSPVDDAPSPLFVEAPGDSVPEVVDPPEESLFVCAAGFLAEPDDLLSVT